MTRQAIVERTIKIIKQLPNDKVQEISDFVDFISKRDEEIQLMHSIQKVVEQGQTFDFLKEEEDLYSEADLKEVYHA